MGRPLLLQLCLRSVWLPSLWPPQHPSVLGGLHPWSPLQVGRSGPKSPHTACWLSPSCQHHPVPSPETMPIHLRALPGPGQLLPWTAGVSGQETWSLEAPGPLDRAQPAIFPGWARLGWNRGWWPGLRFGWFLSVFLLNRYANEGVWDSTNTGDFGKKAGACREPSFPRYLFFLIWGSSSTG